VGRTRLIKTVFLFTKEIQPQLRKKGFSLTLPDFSAYNYGPFSVDVLNDIETLRALEILEVDSIPEAEPFDVLDDLNSLAEDQGTEIAVERQVMDRYRLTDRGAGFCRDMLRSKFSPEEWKFLTEFKIRCNSVSLTVLLRYVYTRYPGYTVNSKIRDRVLKYETLS
jgi:hypothetical protein